MIKVQTRNLYLGTDLTPLFFARTPADFRSVVSEAFLQAVASDFPARAAAIARELTVTRPHLVGMQEAVSWRTSPPSANPAGEEQIEFLQLILEQLNRRGPQYELIVSATGIDATAPTNLGFDIRLTVSDVILVRADLIRQAKLSNSNSANYTSNLELPTVIGPITFLRQWASVDVNNDGRVFRFITTHLEAVAPAGSIRKAQVRELLTGPANTPLPTILLGDFNSEPGSEGDAANDLISAGFVDIWPVVQPADPGFTCGRSSDLHNLATNLDQRIDLILSRGGLRGVTAETVGHRLKDRTPAGLWPSDHAGVVATLKFSD